MLTSLYWRRTNKYGAIAGMLSGTATVLIWHNLVKPLGGVFAIYELLPAFIISLLFIVVSVLCLLAFRPLAAKLRKAPTATNGDRNLGREATVLTTITADLPGRVRLDGVDWNARCATPGDILTPGQRCRVTELHSTLLIVEPVLTESRRA